MENDKWDYSHILGFCGASVQKLERMSLDIDDDKLIEVLATAQDALRDAYKLCRAKSDTHKR